MTDITPSPHWKDIAPAKRMRGDDAHSISETVAWMGLITGVIICKKCGAEERASSLRLPSGRVIKPDEICSNCSAQPIVTVAAKPISREQEWLSVCPNWEHWDSLRRYAQDAIRNEFLKAFERMAQRKTSGIYAMGPSGTFKSTFAWTIAQRCFMQGWTVRAFTINTLQDLILRSYAEEEHWRLIEMLCGKSQNDLLFIDDYDKVGMEGKSTAAPSLARAIYELLNARREASRPVIFTTNAMPSTIDAIYSDQYGPAIRQRLKDMCAPGIDTSKIAPPPKRYND